MFASSLWRNKGSKEKFIWEPLFDLGTTTTVMPMMWSEGPGIKKNLGLFSFLLCVWIGLEMGAFHYSFILAFPSLSCFCAENLWPFQCQLLAAWFGSIFWGFWRISAGHVSLPGDLGNIPTASLDIFILKIINIIILILCFGRRNFWTF